MKWKRPALALLLCTAAIALSLRTHARTTHHLAPQPRTFPTAMPATVLWAWEEPEDLTTIDPTNTGVAYLAESLTLSDRVTIRPRYQPLSVAPGTSVMAVVRIQPTASFKDTHALRTATVKALTNLIRSNPPGLRAFQIDFDATQSQRPFYTAILKQLRPQMPPGMPLSITALVSWCSRNDDWIATLPIDEAVPMFFRLGAHTKPHGSKLGYPIDEPLCRTSNGVSTDETWPAIAPTQRLYIFAPRPWTKDQLKESTTQINQQLTTSNQQPPSSELAQ